jgi:hypothetical protein
MKTVPIILILCAALCATVLTGCPGGSAARDRGSEQAVLGIIKKAGFDLAYVAVEGPVAHIAIGFGDVTPDAAAVLVAMAAELVRTASSVVTVRAQAWTDCNDSAPVFELDLKAADCLSFDEGNLSAEELERRMAVVPGRDVREELFAALSLYDTTPFGLVFRDGTAVIDLTWNAPDFSNLVEKALAMTAHCVVYLPGITGVEFRFQSSGGTLSVPVRVPDAQRAIRKGLTADDVRAAIKVTETGDFFNVAQEAGATPVDNGSQASVTTVPEKPSAGSSTQEEQQKPFQVAYAEYQRLLKEKGINDPVTQAAFKRYQAAIREYQEKNPQP